MQVYELIGHKDLRQRLRSHRGSFVLRGPRGVGRYGVVQEWLETQSRVGVDLTPSVETIRQAKARPDLTYLIDGDRVSSSAWIQLLQPLEVDAFPMVVLTTGFLPAPIATRLPQFTAGYLTESEVTRVLAREFPSCQPRPLLARAAQGTLANIQSIELAAKTFETLDRSLIERKLPDFRRNDPQGLFQALRLACMSVLGYATLPFSAEALSRITKKIAVVFLQRSLPQAPQEARNEVSLFFAEFIGRG